MKYATWILVIFFCLGCAAYGMITNSSGWGWFIFAAVLFSCGMSQQDK